MNSPELQATHESIPEIEGFEQASLEVLKTLLHEPYPGYPPSYWRLHEQWIDSDEFGRAVIPNGPWWVNPADYTDDRHDGPYPGATDFDSHGRPLHPWFREMVQDTEIGVVAGKGFYWHWGPNYTADPIIIRRDLDEPHVLLIKRHDTGQWALPGGFVDDGETGLEAAIREAKEEAGIDLLQLCHEAQTLYQGPVADIRTTAHAWAETTAVRFELSDEAAALFTTLHYKGGDDAEEARWTPVSELNAQLFGSHLLLIAEALACRN